MNIIFYKIQASAFITELYNSGILVDAETIIIELVNHKIEIESAGEREIMNPALTSDGWQALNINFPGDGGSGAALDFTSFAGLIFDVSDSHVFTTIPATDRQILLKPWDNNCVVSSESVIIYKYVLTTIQESAMTFNLTTAVPADTVLRACGNYQG